MYKNCDLINLKELFMQKSKDNYQYISDKVKQLKTEFPSLRGRTDDYAFVSLAVKSNIYKNPAFNLNEHELSSFIVDGVNDGGIDAILSDPSSDTNDLVLCQAKFYQQITFEEIKNAIHKMVDFYLHMDDGRYELFNSDVRSRYLSLFGELGDESKVKFVFYTSAPKSRINVNKLEAIVKDRLKNTEKYSLEVYFRDEIVNEIMESESRRPHVENGRLIIDETDNYLQYEDEAVVVNVSAFSIKELFSLHSINLLSKNLRYYIRKKDIDDAIRYTIDYEPENFWYKNNGITIICDDYIIDGKEVKLKNFSIVNGGQTTYIIFKSAVNKENDFFVPCKVIKSKGNTEDEKHKFSLEIARATNSQKAIKVSDLRSNSPEQIRFIREMRDVGVFYLTKRGEVIPKNYLEKDKNTNISEVGKLALAGIFQLPAVSRNNSSKIFDDVYYSKVFNGNQKDMAGIIRDLLYIDTYFREKFIKKFSKDNKEYPGIPFANNSRTICIAFAGFAARYANNNITDDNIKTIFSHIENERSYEDYLYDIFSNIGGIDHIIEQQLFKEDKDKVDDFLYRLFSKLISEGFKQYTTEKKYNESLNESNFLKKNKSYYEIISNSWIDLKQIINEITPLFKKK